MVLFVRILRTLLELLQLLTCDSLCNPSAVIINVYVRKSAVPGIFEAQRARTGN